MSKNAIAGLKGSLVMSFLVTLGFSFEYGFGWWFFPVCLLGIPVHFVGLAICYKTICWVLGE